MQETASVSQDSSEPKSMAEILAAKSLPDAMTDQQVNDWERQQELSRRAGWHSHFIASRGERYAPCRIANFRCDTPEQTAVVEKLRAYGKNISAEIKAGTNIVAFGPKGTGKDHLLSAMAQHAIYTGHECVWVNGADLFGDFRDRITEDRTESALVYSFVRPTVLYISDPLPPIGNLTDYQATTFFRILDARYSRMRPTWVSVNVADGVELEQRMGPQNADRLRDGAVALYCNWPSYRKVKA